MRWQRLLSSVLLGLFGCSHNPPRPVSSPPATLLVEFVDEQGRPVEGVHVSVDGCCDRNSVCSPMKTGQGGIAIFEVCARGGRWPVAVAVVADPTRFQRVPVTEIEVAGEVLKTVRLLGHPD